MIVGVKPKEVELYPLLPCRVIADCGLFPFFENPLVYIPTRSLVLVFFVSRRMIVDGGLLPSFEARETQSVLPSSLDEQVIPSVVYSGVSMEFSL